MPDKLYIQGDRPTIELSSDEAGWNIEVESANRISDTYHTFGELYEHRCLLFCCLLVFISSDAPMGFQATCWKSKTHWIDGKLEPVWNGWFVAGAELYPMKQITYHLPLKYWNMLADVGSA